MILELFSSFKKDILRDLKLALSSFKERATKLEFMLIFVIIFALSLSLFRVVYVDGKFFIDDGYDRYAKSIINKLKDPSYDLDDDPSLKKFPHKLRIFYSFLVALFSYLFPIGIHTTGVILSTIATLISIYNLNLICKLRDISYNYRIKILIVFVSISSITTNMARFETDMLFLMFVTFTILYYEKYIRNGNVTDFRRLCLFALTATLTRELGVILIIAIFITYVARNIGTKWALLFFYNIFIFSFIILRYWGGYSIPRYIVIPNATERLYLSLLEANVSWNVFWGVFETRMQEYILKKVMESLFYTFFLTIPLAIYGSGVINRLRYYGFFPTTIRIIERIFKDLSFLWFFSYIFFVFLIYSSRGVGRFWIPISFIPLFFLPQALEKMSCSSDIYIQKKNPGLSAEHHYDESRRTFSFSERENKILIIIVALQFSLSIARILLNVGGFGIS